MISKVKIYLKLFSWDFIIIQKFCLIRKLIAYNIVKTITKKNCTFHFKHHIACAFIKCQRYIF